MKNESAKVFIFASESNAGVDLMLEVANYDDRFPQICKTAIENWQNSNEDYMSFMLSGLRLAGYEISALKEFDELTA